MNSDGDAPGDAPREALYATVSDPTAPGLPLRAGSRIPPGTSGFAAGLRGGRAGAGHRRGGRPRRTDDVAAPRRAAPPHPPGCRRPPGRPPLRRARSPAHRCRHLDVHLDVARRQPPLSGFCSYPPMQDVARRAEPMRFTFSIVPPLPNRKSREMRGRESAAPGIHEPCEEAVRCGCVSRRGVTDDPSVIRQSLRGGFLPVSGPRLRALAILVEET